MGLTLFCEPCRLAKRAKRLRRGFRATLRDSARPFRPPQAHERLFVDVSGFASHREHLELLAGVVDLAELSARGVALEEGRSACGSQR